MILSEKLKQLRLANNMTQKEVSDYLGVDVSTYAHYEAGRRSPNADKLRLLAIKYEIDDVLLGAELPIEVNQQFDEDKLDNLRDVLAATKWTEGDNSYRTNKETFDRLREAARPILKEWEESFNLPNIDINKYPSGTTVKKVRLNQRAQALINEYLKKSEEYFGMM